MNTPCIIIAEAGVNHNGNLEMAKQLIRVAAEAGADYVKFQTFSADKLVTRTAKQAEYQKKNLQSGENDSQYTMLKKLELSRADHEELVKTCNYYGIKFLSTAFDNENLIYLTKDLDLDYIKIPSGELTNYPYLRLAAQLNKPIILSTGMATLPEILESVNLLKEFGVQEKDLYVLHCTTEYPALISEVNLKAMDTIAEATGCTLWMSEADWAKPNTPLNNYLFPIANCDFTQVQFCEEGEVISAAGLDISVMETPGHTHGSVCYRCGDALFSGDTLFAGSCGRTDLPGGDWATIHESLRRLAALPENLTVYPGHGESTTLEQERKQNPYLY